MNMIQGSYFFLYLKSKINLLNCLPSLIAEGKHLLVKIITQNYFNFADCLNINRGL